MTKTQTSTFGINGSGAIPGFKAFAQANQSALNIMTHMGIQSMRHMIEMNQQYLDFIKHRLNEDIKTGV